MAAGASLPASRFLEIGTRDLALAVRRAMTNIVFLGFTYFRACP
jgi:hypothetical protein